LRVIAQEVTKDRRASGRDALRSTLCEFKWGAGGEVLENVAEDGELSVAHIMLSNAAQKAAGVPRS